MHGRAEAPFKTQLLKWVGNKQRFAHEIVSNFPRRYGTYFEPFIGSGAVLATLAPRRAVGSDAYGPLTEIWSALREDPETLKSWYGERWRRLQGADKAQVYAEIRASFNRRPNGADLLFLCRSCYGGVVRFRQADGHMSTPCGIHQPISAESFSSRVDIWNRRVAGARFIHGDYREVLALARRGDLVYCDPPYSDSQSILYGAQRFKLEDLIAVVAGLKKKGVFVALSIDGTKKSGSRICELPIPAGLFERELFVNCGRSMLRRFQKKDESLEDEVVSDRLLLTY